MDWPSEKELNEIDMSGILNNMPENEIEWKNYVNSKAGQEHYRLLRWLSDNFTKSEIVEIGVYKGCSGLALSSNVFKKVTGFDLVKNIVCNTSQNYNFILDDYRNHPEIIKKSNLIFYDTDHNGVLEREFIEYIKNIKFSGMVIFDDIYLNEEMKSFWKELTCTYPCTDLTRIGHCTGTGVIWV